MRRAWEQRTDRQWIGLMVVGVLIIMGVVLLQGVVNAANPAAEEQRVERERGDVALQVLSGVRGSRIGVSVEEVETSSASGSVDEGAYVNEVREATPAAEAGFESGDVVVEFDGERVRSASQLSRLVRETPAGRAVSATVMRDGDRQALEVIPEAGPGWMSNLEPHLPDVAYGDWSAYLPDPDEIRRGLRLAIPAGPGAFGFSGDYSAGIPPNRLGVEVTAVSPQLADYFGVDEGVLVATVQSDSVASAAGVRAGDVITRINDEPVDGLASLRRHVAGLEPGGSFTIGVMRDGREMNLNAETEDARSRRPSRHDVI